MIEPTRISSDPIAEGSLPELPRRNYLTQGVIKHAEHWVDLILEQAREPGREVLDGFLKVAESLITQIRDKELTVINEKIDGSPAVVFGSDSAGLPFVAYKGGFDRKGDQILIRSPQDPGLHYEVDNPVGQILGELITELADALKRFPLRNLIFQADVLFTERSGTRRFEESSGQIVLKPNPNGVEYRIDADSKYYPHIDRAAVGVAVHTVFEGVAEQNRIGMRPYRDSSVIEQLLTTLRSERVFAIDPWTRKVKIDQQMQGAFSANKEAEVRALLRTIESGVETLSPKFREVWGESFHKIWSTFLNSELKPGRKGGLYRAAATGEEFDFAKLISCFRGWYESRLLSAERSGKRDSLVPKSISSRFDLLLEQHSAELDKLCRAYFNGVQIHYLLQPHLKEAYRSKLGGGKIEGFMLKLGEIQVKFVDRLDFTMTNFAGGERRHYRAALARPAEYTQVKPRSKFRELEQLPKPYDRWRPGAAFVIGKHQPPHTGHIAMIRAAIDQNGPKNLYVVSSDKQPNLRAKTWSELGAAPRRRDIENRDYHYFLPAKLRKEILREALGISGRVYLISPTAFRSYLSRNSDQDGKVKLVIGTKEIEAGRFDSDIIRYGSHLEPLVIPMQKEGISGTQVRDAIKRVVDSGDFEADLILQRAFEYLPEQSRNRIISKVVEAWCKVDAKAQRLVRQSKRSK